MPPTPSIPTPTIARRNESMAEPAPAPWWRFGIVWLTFGLPAMVVVAAIATGVIAWRHADAVVTPHALATRTPNQPSSPGDALAPAVGARNHAATPSR